MTQVDIEKRAKQLRGMLHEDDLKLLAGVALARAGYFEGEGKPAYIGESIEIKKAMDLGQQIVSLAFEKMARTETQGMHYTSDTVWRGIIHALETVRTPTAAQRV